MAAAADSGAMFGGPVSPEPGDSRVLVLEKLCCVRLNCLRPFLERWLRSEWEPVNVDDLDDPLPEVPKKKRSSRWRSQPSQFAVYGSKPARKYEHRLDDGTIGRTTQLRLNLNVDVFVYEKDDANAMMITRKEVDANRAALRTLRKVAGTDWPFLDERDVDDILLRSNHHVEPLQIHQPGLPRTTNGFHHPSPSSSSSSSGGHHHTSSSRAAASSARPFRWNF